mgnify:CR=1 FL=1
MNRKSYDKDNLSIAIYKRCKLHYGQLNFWAYLDKFCILTGILLGLAVFGLSSMLIYSRQSVLIPILATVCSVISFAANIIPKMMDIQNQVDVRHILWEEYQSLLDAYMIDKLNKDQAYEKYQQLLLSESDVWMRFNHPASQFGNRNGRNYPIH